MFKVIAALVVVSTLITMTGVASIVPVSAQVVTDGALVKTADSDDVYIVKIIGSKMFKRLILNPAIFESYGHLSWSNIITVSQATLDSYTTSNMVIEVTPAGAAVSGKVYIVSSAAGADTGTKQWLNVTAADFEAAGLDWDSLYQINATEAGAGFYPEGAAITDASDVEGATGDSDGITTPGAEGSLTLTLRATPSAVDLDEGGDVDEVAGFKLEADNSDIQIERLDVQLEADDTTSEKPWTYFTRAKVLVDGDVVATETISSADDFIVSENGGSSQDSATDEYTLRLTGLDFVVPAEEYVIIEVQLETEEDIDSGNMTQSWNVGIPTNGVRGKDGAGIDVYASTAYVGRTFDVSADATATLTPALSDNTPDDSYAEVDTSNNTEDIETVRFTLEADEGDVTLDDLSATVTTAGEADESVIIIAAHLYAESVDEDNRIGSEDVPAGGRITFDNIEYTIEDGEEIEFIITVDVTSLGGTLDAGDTVQVTVDGDSITGTDELDNAVTGADVNPTGETIYFYEVFPTFELVSTSFEFVVEDSTPNSRANLSIVFDVTAVNGDIFISDAASDAESADGVEVTVTGDQAGAVVVDLTSNATAPADNDFKVPSGTTKRFTVNLGVTGEGTHVQAQISEVMWGTVSGTTSVVKDFDWDDFETESKIVYNANN
jgi:hypothetical protein